MPEVERKSAARRRSGSEPIPDCWVGAGKRRGGELTVADDSCVTAVAAAGDRPSAPGRDRTSAAAANRAVVEAAAGMASNAKRLSAASCAARTDSCAARTDLNSLPTLPANASNIDFIVLSKRRSAAADGVVSSSSLLAYPIADLVSCFILGSAGFLAAVAASSASAAACATASTAAALGVRERDDDRLAALPAASTNGISVCDARMDAPVAVCNAIDEDDEEDDITKQKNSDGGEQQQC